MKLFEDRFESLESEMLNIERSKHTENNEMFGNSTHVDDELFDEWKVKVKNLLNNSCGKESEHYKEFVSVEKQNSSFDSSYIIFRRTKSVFKAAKEDYLGGYIVSLKSLITADVFSKEIDQAEELLNAGYCLPAAVVAGVVIETCLREKCISVGIPLGKLDKMNADLAKAGVYNGLIQKRITAIADLRNKAAHGKIDEFTSADVKAMISEVIQITSNFMQNANVN